MKKNNIQRKHSDALVSAISLAQNAQFADLDELSISAILLKVSYFYGQKMYNDFTDLTNHAKSQHNIFIIREDGNFLAVYNTIKGINISCLQWEKK